MDNVSRPLIALLVGTVAFFALWLVALRPSSSPSGGASGGVGAYRSAIEKAHQAVAASAAASVAHGAAVAPTPDAAARTSAAARTHATASASATATTAAPSGAPTRLSPATSRRLNVVERALRAQKVIALLFYNPAAADDRALKQELAAVPTGGKRVVKLAVPLPELARYTAVTNQVAINASPTLVLVDPDQKASTIVGFADRFEIAQRVSDALAVK